MPQKRVNKKIKVSLDKSIKQQNPWQKTAPRNVFQKRIGEIQHNVKIIPLNLATQFKKIQQIYKMKKYLSPNIEDIQIQIIDINSISEEDQIESLNFSDQSSQNQELIETSFGNQPLSCSKKARSERSWTLEDEYKLIELHKQHGNRWTLLARHFQGMQENSIKNRFYSRLRKSIRKLNKAIGILELRKYNKFKLNIIFKLSNISEGKMADKQKIVPQIFKFYREFLYNLVQFSQQNQNVTLSKQSFQNIAEIENLILPLVALENLFRLVRGERVAKGKKKNIAYLRQFSFRLSLQNEYRMVITKENILLLNGNQKSCLDLQRYDFIHNNQPVITRENFFASRETLPSENRGFQNLEFSLRKASNDFEEPDSAIDRSISLFKWEEDGDKTQTQVWKDYLGQEMKEYDIYSQLELNLDQLNQLLGFYSLKSSCCIDDNFLW